LKVKLGDKIYDSTQEPIMLIMDDEVKEHISCMHPSAYTYCSCPDSMTENEIKAFMGIKDGDDNG
jgi:hypothetical protein